MAYVPPVPGFVPVSYGQGYGNWQQYAGFNKDNPFGVSPEIRADKSYPKIAVPAPVEDATVVPTAQVQPAIPPNQMGVSPVNAMGTPSVSSMGVVQEDALKRAVNSHFGE